MKACYVMTRQVTSGHFCGCSRNPPPPARSGGMQCSASPTQWMPVEPEARLHPQRHAPSHYRSRAFGILSCSLRKQAGIIVCQLASALVFHER